MAAPFCIKCTKARPGQRVVRGPYWCGKDEDGGSDYLGTVVSVCQPGTGSGYTTHPVEVLWDAGEGRYYRAGCTNETCDLRLIDAGPTGITFPNTTCGSCETNNVVGTLWKCAVCKHYCLCHCCYMNDKHNVEHEFVRYDEPGTNGVRVPSRKNSTKVSFYGIFPGSEVQSRNEVKTGIVGNVRGKARLLRKTDAGKLWYYSTDKVDDNLKFVKATKGGYYYRDHMPIIALPGHDPKDIDLFAKNQKTMSRGDSVRVISDEEKIVRLHNSHPDCGLDDWEKKHWPGRDGRVLSSDFFGWLEVWSSGYYGIFHPECLMPLQESSGHPISRDISTECKGLGYGLSKVTALHVACYSGEEDVVRMLVMSEADLEEADGNGDRAVHYAAASEQCRILEVLLNAGVDIGACNTFNETALHVAIKENSVDCARLLAKNTKDSEINIQDNTGDAVLHSAINAGMQQEIISLLLQVPTVDVALKNDKGETPLHIAASKANLWATQQILQKSRDIADEKNKQNMTALYIAVSNNVYEVAQTLITQGHSNVDIQCGSGLKTALATAVASGLCDLVELLVESGADINASDSEGNAPLHLCVTNTQPLILSSPSTAPKMTLMTQKLQEANSQLQLDGLAMAGLLASKGGDLQQKNKKGLTPPQLCNSTALIEKLLFWNTQERAAGRYSEQLSALINAKDTNGMVLLHLEAMNGRHHIGQMLLEQEYTPVDTVCGKELKTALSIAVQRGHCKFVKVLIGAGADVNKQEANGNTPLHICLVSQHCCEIAELLVAAGADVNKQDANGNTPLHICLMNQHCEIAELLVAAGADVNKQDANGNTPLHISLMSRPAVKASKLRSRMAPKLKAIATELEKVNHDDIDTSLALACFFISSGGSLKLKNAQGLNPLNFAGTMAVVRTLLKWAPKAREPPPEEASVESSSENDAAGADGAASSTESDATPGPSDEQANCSPAKEEPKEEEIDDRHACAICMEKERTVAFLCGHGTCQDCATKIQHCHVCRAPVEKIIKLYEG